MSERKLNQSSLSKNSILNELDENAEGSISILPELVGLEVGIAALAVAFVGVGSMSWKDIDGMSMWRAEWEAKRQLRARMFVICLGGLSAITAMLGGVEAWQKKLATNWNACGIVASNLFSCICTSFTYV